MPHGNIAECHPSLTRGIVWCHTCSQARRVNVPACLSGGWPKCCGQTMSIDSPEERKALTTTKEQP